MQIGNRHRCSLLERQRSCTGVFFEQIYKMVCVLDSNLGSDLVDGQICCEKEPFGGIDPATVEIAHR